MQSGQDTPLKNVWDEICVQVQGEESFFFKAIWEQQESMSYMRLKNLMNA